MESAGTVPKEGLFGRPANVSIVIEANPKMPPLQRSGSARLRPASREVSAEQMTH